MESQIIKQIFINVVNNIDSLNEVLKEFNDEVDVKKIATLLDSKSPKLDSFDASTYMGSVLYYYFNKNLEDLRVSLSDEKKIIIINYINTILEELEYKGIDFEVIKWKIYLQKECF